MLSGVSLNGFDVTTDALSIGWLAIGYNIVMSMLKLIFTSIAIQFNFLYAMCSYICTYNYAKSMQQCFVITVLWVLIVNYNT